MCVVLGSPTLPLWALRRAAWLSQECRAPAVGQSSSQVSEAICNFASLQDPIGGCNILGGRPPTQHPPGFNLHLPCVQTMLSQICPLQLNTKCLEIVNYFPGNAALLFHNATFLITAFPGSSARSFPCLCTVEHQLIPFALEPISVEFRAALTRYSSFHPHSFSRSSFHISGRM